MLNPTTFLLTVREHFNLTHTKTAPFLTSVLYRSVSLNSDLKEQWAAIKGSGHLFNDPQSPLFLNFPLSKSTKRTPACFFKKGYQIQKRVFYTILLRSCDEIAKLSFTSVYSKIYQQITCFSFIRAKTWLINRKTNNKKTKRWQALLLDNSWRC